MNQKLNILAPTRYPSFFNFPRNSRHNIFRRDFLPLNKISKKIECILVFIVSPLKKFNLIHAFNSIPLGLKPFVISFESHLPRAFGYEKSFIFSIMSNMLASNRCIAIFAISKYAQLQFLHQHRNHPWYYHLTAKLNVRYPNVPIPNTPDCFVHSESKSLKLIFVGNHFARKGGLVALRIAKLALEKGLSLEIDIISSLVVGNESWVDPTRKGFFDEELKLLHSLSNIKFYQNLPNNEVISLIGKSHFLLLPTLSDTFGFTAIEAMANFTPVIATNQCALPEFIQDGKNGWLIPLETNEFGEWIHINHPNRDSAEYELIFNETINRLVQEIYKRLENIQLGKDYKNLRINARQTAENTFSSSDANQFWDDFYSKKVGQRNGSIAKISNLV